jgi:hypothetical protein
MQTRSVLVAAFNDRNEAQIAFDELEQAGFKEEELGFAIRGDDAVRGGMITDATGTKDGRGAATGMATGGLIGGVLGAVAALTVPGIGPVLAGGILAAAFGGVAAGVVTGGILGALSGLGVSEEEAKYYQNKFEEGKAIVTVQAGNRYHDAVRILERHGGYPTTASH